MTDFLPRRFLAAVFAACLFAGLALVAADGNAPLFMAVNAGLAGLPPAVSSSLTILGQGQVALALVTPALWMAPRVMAAALFATPIGLLLTHVPKHVFAQPRPGAVLPLDGFHHVGHLLTGHNSMPSGHTLTAFTLVAALAWAAPRVARSWALSLLALAGGTVVGLSRVAVGAHWPGDVLVGAALGGLAGLLGAGIAARWPVLEGPRGRLAMIVASAVALVALWPMDLGYPDALPLQRVAVAVGLACCAYALWRWWRPAAAAPAEAAP